MTQCEVRPYRAYLRLSQIVSPDGLLPLTAMTWWRHIRRGEVSRGVLLSPGVRAWTLSEVLAFANQEAAS